MQHPRVVSFPSLLPGPFRLSGLVLSILLVMLPVSSTARWPVWPPVAGAPVEGAVKGAAHQPAWQWPIAPPHPVLRPFEAPATRYSAGHRGIDIGATPGTPVVSPDDGVVHFAGTVVDRPVVSIRLEGGLIASMEPVSAVVVEGDVVGRGETIGEVATGGHCSDGCLHLGVRLHGEYVSPMLYLGGIAPSVLLPTRDVG